MVRETCGEMGGEGDVLFDDEYSFDDGCWR